MPLRSRLRRAFTRGSQDDPNLTGKTSSKSSKRNSAAQESNVYQPGEKMPPLKYRRPVAPEHKAHLEAFSWAKAWRRQSDQSIYSPMGSRMPSRKTSYSSFGRRSFGGRSRKSLNMSRGPTMEREDGSGVDSGVGASVAGDDRPERLREGSDEEGDVTNVGLSRNPTIDPKRNTTSDVFTGHLSQSIKSSSRPQTSDRSDRTARRGSTAPQNETPFTPEDLELALKKSNLEAKNLESTKEESDNSGDASMSPESIDERPAGGLRPREGVPAITFAEH